MHISRARLASFRYLGFISDPLIVSKFHNETHDPKGQENKIYTIVKGRETFYRRHTVQVTSCSEVKYVLKRESAFLDLHSFISNDIVCTKINDKCNNFDFKIVNFPFLMMMFLALLPMESIYLNSFFLLEHLAMLLTSTLAINC